MENPRHHRHSLFWPTLLVGVGLIWLLVNLGVIAPISVSSILQFWPILLIVFGLDILFSRSYAWVGNVVGILAVGGLVAYLILTPHAAAQISSQSQQENFTVPLEETSSVTYNLETASEPVAIYSLDAISEKLIDANITHVGKINFSAVGTTNKMVSLSETSDPSNWFTWALTSTEMKWNVGLAAGIPADIKINGGSGSINANLVGMKLQTLSADLGSGSSVFTFPQSDQEITANLNSGSGSVEISLPEKTDITLRLQSASGSLNITLPTGSAVQVEVMDSGSGGLSLPDSLSLISGDKDSGTWQSAGYAKATTKIEIKILDRGSGSIFIN
jgi:hypothetical protein